MSGFAANNLGRVAQLVRAPSLYLGGPWFESMHAHQQNLITLYMDPEKLQSLFEEKYEHKLGLSYDEWLATAPETEDQAYEKLQEIDDELKQIQDQYPDATPEAKDSLEDEKDRLKLEYDIIEDMFGLELKD